MRIIRIYNTGDKMENYLDVLLDATIDTLKILPILLLAYFLIEFLEYKKAFQFEKSGALRGRASPIMGALFGSVPQCGFSIISTDLYSQRKISVGALIAVYIATSDEALPIMISNYHSIPALVVLLLVKIVFAVLVGYLAILLYDKVFFKKKIAAQQVQPQQNEQHEEDDEHEEKHHEIGCCHHDIEAKKFEWAHPLVHSLKIILFIFIVNLIMGTIIYFWGEENLNNFLTSSYVFQPVLAVLIGLIPNCASSVILTELYLTGGISFGAVMAGLCVNAGLGIIYLFKKQKNIKEIVFILLMLIIPSLVLGYVLHYLPIDLLSIIK